MPSLQGGRKMQVRPVIFTLAHNAFVALWQAATVNAERMTLTASSMSRSAT
jgi:hypothetical protein